MQYVSENSGRGRETPDVFRNIEGLDNILCILAGCETPPAQLNVKLIRCVNCTEIIARVETESCRWAKLACVLNNKNVRSVSQTPGKAHLCARPHTIPLLCPQM